MRLLIVLALIALTFAADKKAAAPKAAAATPITTGQQGWGRPQAWSGQETWAQPAWEGNWGHH
jgi:hypothetical protein